MMESLYIAQKLQESLKKDFDRIKNVLNPVREQMTMRSLYESEDALLDTINMLEEVQAISSQLLSLANSKKDELDNAKWILMAETGTDIQFSDDEEGYPVDKPIDISPLFIDAARQGVDWYDVVVRDQYERQLVDAIEDRWQTKPRKSQPKGTAFTEKVLNEYEGAKFGCNLRTPSVKSLDQIPSAIYHYGGDKKNAAGLYISLSPGFYTRIPIPGRDTNKGTTKCCREKIASKCSSTAQSNPFLTGLTQNRGARYQKMHSKCKMMHYGEPYVRIPNALRCDTMPLFGTPDTLEEDMEAITDADMRTLLMGAISDCLFASVWYNRRFADKKLVVSDLHLCGPSFMESAIDSLATEEAEFKRHSDFTAERRNRGRQ